MTQLNTCKNVPDHTMNTKSSHFEGKKRAKFQTKSIEKLKSPFYAGDLVTCTGEWESGRAGDQCRIRESWDVYAYEICSIPTGLVWLP